MQHIQLPPSIAGPSGSQLGPRRSTMPHAHRATHDTLSSMESDVSTALLDHFQSQLQDKDAELSLAAEIGLALAAEHDALQVNRRVVIQKQERLACISSLVVDFCRKTTMICWRSMRNWLQH